MSKHEVDFELVRLISDLEKRLEAAKEDGFDAPAFLSALKECRKRAPEGVIATSLAALLDVVEAGQAPSVWADLAASAFEHAQSTIFQEDGADPGELERIARNLSGLDDGGEGAAEDAADGTEAVAATPEPDETDGDGDAPTGPTLDDAASLLVRMDPTDMEAIRELHQAVGAVASEFGGLPKIRNRLHDAVDALSEITRAARPRKAKREQAVDEVGRIIESVMEMVEDAALLSGAEVNEGAEPRSEQADPGSEPAAEGAEPESPDAQVAAPAPTPAPVAGAPAEVPAAAAGEGPDELEEFFELPGDLDETLLVDFLAEGTDYLEQSEAALLHLEQNPKDKESINVVFRAFHTIKGVSGFLGLGPIETLAHHAETLLSDVREGTQAFNGTVAEITLRASDALRALLDAVGQHAPGDPVDIPAGAHAVLDVLQDPELSGKIESGATLFESAPSGAAESAPAAVATPMSVGSSDQSVRVKTDRLDHLVDLVGELVVAQSMIAEDATVQADRGELYRKVDRADKILRELQDLSTSLRMVPLRPAFQKLNRVVRDVSRKIGKPVNFLTEGEETELDRNMVDIVTDPLVHMIRNALDHGIESPEERKAAGKPERGTLTLNAFHAGGNVIVEVSDDGRGLDRERILAKAIEKGIVESDRGMPDEEIYELIFAPGFSTAAAVTDVSGRGVGMDVVKKNVESLRGRIEIQSDPGKGSRFSIRLPLTLAITDGLLIRSGSQRYIVPMVKIHSSFRPTAEDLHTVAGGKGELVQLHEQLLPMVRLHRLYQIPDAERDPTRAVLVIVGEGARRCALLVDDLLGQQQFVVKALRGQVAETPGVAGGAIMADGAVGLILEPDELIELARNDVSLIETPVASAADAA